MERKTIVILGAALLLLADGVLYAPTSLADPPWDPGNGTIFAPIEETKREISLTLVTDGLIAPLKGVIAPGLPHYLFVVDQPGQIHAINLTTGGKTLSLDVGDRLVTLGVFGAGTFDERGLLGLAFHPNFASNGLLYMYTSEPNNGPPTFPTTLPMGAAADHQNVIAEWRAFSPTDPSAGVDPASRRELMRVDSPQFSHNGGDLAFGPDGMLYISMGDGGGADDRDGQLFTVPGGAAAPIVGHGLDGNAQKLTNPLGKIMRIDVDGSSSANGQYGIPADNPFVGMPGLVDEIFAFGLRNPYRFSFDSKKGDLYVGDVGQNDIEEVSVVISGANYGWPIKEGTLFFDHNLDELGFATPVDPGNFMIPADLVDPVAQYDTHHEGHSVIGGFVYRGSELKRLRGRYIFGDFSTIFNFPGGPHDHGRLLHLRPGGDEGLRKIVEFQIVPGNALSLALLGWGQDTGGELYALGNITGTPFGTGGVVLKLVPVDNDDDNDD